MAQGIELRVEQDDESKEARAAVHMPGQEPLEVATLRAAFAADPVTFDAWYGVMKAALTRWLIAQGRQVKRVRDSRDGGPSAGGMS